MKLAANLCLVLMMFRLCGDPLFVRRIGNNFSFFTIPILQAASTGIFMVLHHPGFFLELSLESYILYFYVCFFVFVEIIFGKVRNPPLLKACSEWWTGEVNHSKDNENLSRHYLFRIVKML